jgi:hypothetical protein
VGGRLVDGGAAGDVGFGALFDFAAGEEDAPAAGEADEADVGAEADDAPVVAAAGVGLAQAEDVVEAEVLGHGSIISGVKGGGVLRGASQRDASRCSVGWSYEGNLCTRIARI